MIRKLIYYILHDQAKLGLAIITRLAPIIPDKQYLKWRFRLEMGYPLNLNNPKTFSEKLQWLKLYNRKPEYTLMVDKYAAKGYVANIIGDEYIIPTLGVWDRFEDIDFDKLPNQFVLKTTHGGGGGGVVICKDKTTFNIDKAKSILERSLKQDIYTSLKEWPYKNVKKRIIAEEFIETDNGELKDYKLFCFNGIPRYCQVIAGRETDITTIDWYDREWNHQHFHEPKDYPFSEKGHSRPRCLDEMWNIATKLSQGQPFLRVDFYEISNTIKFGELTFFPTSGFGGFKPIEWDYKLGEWIKLPKID
ncbi:MAG: glycosyl transferase [Alistipes sp.]|nr:glycosyl transferase [Alistipes sp.]